MGPQKLMFVSVPCGSPSPTPMPWPLPLGELPGGGGDICVGTAHTDIPEAGDQVEPNLSQTPNNAGAHFQTCASLSSRVAGVYPLRGSSRAGSECSVGVHTA